MTLIKEQNNTSIPLPTIIILLGIMGLIIGFETCNEIVDEGQLTSIEITVKKRPGLIHSTKKTPEHYRFYTNENLSPFNISGTAMSTIEDNDAQQQAFQQIKVNDTLIVIFQSNRQNSLDNPLEPVELYGLADSKREYFSPGIIIDRTRKRTKIIFLSSAALLITGLVLKQKKIMAKMNKPA
jgi:hypothetical protein